MSYYHEARKHEKNIRKQANKHKDFIDKRREESQRLRALADPHQSVIAEGRTIKIHRATETVRMDDALMPWQGRRGNMIDRFDARAMMDFITEYNGPRQPEECKQVECLLNYERFRSIVDCTRLGVPPSKHLERVALEVRKKLVLTQPPKEQGGVGAKGGKRPAVLHGVEGHYGPGSGDAGKYSAVEPPSASVTSVTSVVASLPGISKEDQEILAMLEDGDDDSEDTSSSEEEEEEEEVIGGPGAGEELTDQQVDRLAESYGITGRETGYQFTRLLRYERREREAARQHKIEERAKQGKKSKKRSRDNYQGFGSGKDGRDGYRGASGRSYGHRGSPTYDDYLDPRQDRRSRRWDRKELKEVIEVPKIEFITTFSCEDPAPTEEQEASEDEEEQGISHFDLMSSFFPAVATKLAGGAPLTQTIGAFGCRPEPPPVRPPSPSPPRSLIAPAAKKKAPAPKPAPKPIEALTPAERLKLRMRAQLNKQIKTAKQTEQKKAEQERKETQAVVQSLQRKPADACVKVSTSSRTSSRRSSRSRSPRGRSPSRSPTPRRPRRSSYSRSRSRSRASKSRGSRKRTPSRSRSRSRSRARHRHRSRSSSPSRERGRRRRSRSRSRR